MTLGSLFSGIEGFAEGAKRAGGITILFHVEKQAFCHFHCIQFANKISQDYEISNQQK